MTLKKSADRKSISGFTIIKLLKTFSSKELIEFEKLLNSPYFNNHSTVIKLFGELKKYYPNFEGEGLSKQNLFEAVKKGMKYDDKLLQKYFSRMNKLAEEYLNLTEMRNEYNSKEINVIYQLSKRNLNEVYSRRLNEFEIYLDSKSKLNDEYYFVRHKLSKIKYNHSSSGNLVYLHKKELLGSYDNLINYFVLNAAHYINQLSSDRYSYKIPEELNIRGSFYSKQEMQKNLASLISSTPSSNIKRHLYLELILNDMKMNSAKYGLSAYKKIKELVYANSGMLNRDMLLYYVKRLNVFCILENNAGIRDMRRELFENYKFLFENELFSQDENPDLGILDYRAILFNALRINEIEWAEKFITESREQIREDSRENFFNFGYSVLLFVKKNYSGALDHLSMIRNESLPVTLDIYILKIKLFYELGFCDSALSVADSFRHFIKGNKLISDYMAAHHNNFIKYFKSVLRLKNNPAKVKFNKLPDELKNTAQVRDKDWLIEKIEELADGREK